MSDRSAAPFPAPPAAAASRGRILVVDDDRLVLATVVHGLADAGFDIIDADNGDDAILLAREHRPDLALLDIRMDGMSGFDVARYLRDALQVPFVFLWLQWALSIPLITLLYGTSMRRMRAAMRATVNASAYSLKTWRPLLLMQYPFAVAWRKLIGPFNFI